MLIQRDDSDYPRPVAYFSRKLKGPETRYSTIDAEALAVVEAVRNFDPYLYAKHFTIYTDHQPLVYTFSRRTKSTRMSRWAHELMFYDYNIRYKLGAHNHVPDILSRAFVEEDCQAADVAPVENVALLDEQAVRQAQRDDPTWRPLIAFLTDGALPPPGASLPLDDFEMKDKLLYRLRRLPDRLVHQLVVPTTLQGLAIKQVHDEAHPGVYRTYCKLQEQLNDVTFIVST